MRCLLDTNICIYLIKSHPPQVLARLQAQTRGSVVISVVTYAGLRAGLESSKETKRAGCYAFSVWRTCQCLVKID